MKSGSQVRGAFLAKAATCGFFKHNAGRLVQIQICFGKASQKQTFVKQVKIPHYLGS